MQPLIFLDIDGVLNSHHSDYELYQPYIKNLKTLVDATDAQIILSSSWQMFVKKENNEIVPKNKNTYGHALVDALAKENLKIFDKVVDDDILPSNKRHKEILNYLKKRFNYEINYPNFVILDDEDYGFNSELTLVNPYDVLKGHHVKTFAGEYNFIPDDAQGFNTTKLTEALYIMKSLI